MHDTAFHLGTLAMNMYADLRTDSILEIGSRSVNGGLRENALPTTHYIGVDIEEGEGVDLIAELGKPLPVEDASFDLVIASSVFEHDPCFWMTFLEMVRAAKDGAYIYINAPSNGIVHRFPQDNWRFYPDSGRALAQWAASQGSPVTLVESFIANREKDMWNDFVAVFRKGPITKTLPKVSLHEHVSCTDVVTWKSTEILHPSQDPQDIILLRQAEERAVELQDRLADSENERQQQSEDLAAALKERELFREQAADADKVRDNLRLLESELRQRQEEIEQTRLEVVQGRSSLAQAHKERAALERELDELQSKLSRLSNSSRDEIDQLSAQCSELQRQARSTQADLERLNAEFASDLSKAEAERMRAQAATRAAEGKLADRFQELATLTHLLRQQENHTDEVKKHLDWVLALHQRTASQPKWWSLMPQSWRVRRERRKLQLAGLFNADAYLERYPDVAAAGLDPLDHYLRHGIYEDRVRIF
jgi:SAM-dependent methyltransferase